MMHRRLSIRTSIGLVIGAMGLLLLSGSAIGVMQAQARDHVARLVAALTSIDQSLTATVVAFRRSRVTILETLKSSQPIDPEGDARILRNKDLVDTNFAQVTTDLVALNLVQFAPIINKLRTAHEALVALRPRITAAIHQTRWTREASIVDEGSAIFSAWELALSTATDAVDAGLQAIDPYIGQLLTAKQAATAMVLSTGSQISRADIAAAAEKSWTANDVAGDTQDRVRQDLAWEALAAFEAQPDTPSTLLSAIANIRRDSLPYLQGPLRQAAETLAAGHRLEVNVRAFEKRNTEAVQPVVEAANVAMNAIAEQATQQQRASLRALAGNGVTLAFAVILSVSGMLLARRRITAPIKRLADAVRHLAERDTTIAIPGQDRADEIGEMAAAVVVFRDAMIRGQELAKLAAEQQEAWIEKAAESTMQIEAVAAAQADALERIVEGLAQLSAGNLGFHLPEPMAPEYEIMRDLFNQAVGHLLNTVQHVLARTQAIGGGATELANAADDLAQRTQLQAGSLEQAAAALAQITATIQQTAAASLQAQSLTADASAEAEQSAEVVNHTVAAMGEIHASARSIARIIGLIDEIGLQTNLLALNAAIEAANAGETGRGFALVAHEVRGLAQRSALAAKEIKSLVMQALGHVTSGVDLVDATGQALDRIRTGLAEINAAVTVIAAGAREQASGISEVNTTVAQMEKVTQQNAAMVEQSTAAVHALAHETDELNRAMARFKLDTAA